MKKVECKFCGKKFHRNRIGPHMKHCEKNMAVSAPPKRKYAKRKVTHPSQLPPTEFTVEYPTHVIATLQVEIDMVKGIELGVIKFVAKD